MSPSRALWAPSKVLSGTWHMFYQDEGYDPVSACGRSTLEACGVLSPHPSPPVGACPTCREVWRSWTGFGDDFTNPLGKLSPYNPNSTRGKAAAARASAPTPKPAVPAVTATIPQAVIPLDQVCEETVTEETGVPADTDGK